MGSSEDGSPRGWAMPAPDVASSSHAANRVAGRRRVLLLSVATFLVVWAWGVVLQDPVYRDQRQALLARRVASSPQPTWMDYSAREARDPPMGTPLPMTPAGREIRSVVAANRAGYLLAWLGSCDSCTSLSLERLTSQTKPRGIRLLAFAHGEKERLRQRAASYPSAGLEIPVIFDADRGLSTALNAYYTGRIYYFTSDWRLRWLEHDGRIDNHLFQTGRFDRVLEETR